eukprot:TRINITY_DN17904_c0_g2_i1.p1 TRINITY_DN17904_c0_g2~~TRINITY_DN17904_c0_g2_i1.p1  ORF type:complete len:348 (-),score=96.50 TRINITY_DN17904_c0_g2_i1:283-1326(-)
MAEAEQTAPASPSGKAAADVSPPGSPTNALDSPTSAAGGLEATQKSGLDATQKKESASDDTAAKKDGSSDGATQKKEGGLDSTQKKAAAPKASPKKDPAMSRAHSAPSVGMGNLGGAGGPSDELFERLTQPKKDYSQQPSIIPNSGVAFKYAIGIGAEWTMQSRDAIKEDKHKLVTEYGPDIASKQLDVVRKGLPTWTMKGRWAADKPQGAWVPAPGHYVNPTTMNRTHPTLKMSGRGFHVGSEERKNLNAAPTVKHKNPKSGERCAGCAQDKCLIDEKFFKGQDFAYFEEVPAGDKYSPLDSLSKPRVKAPAITGRWAVGCEPTPHRRGIWGAGVGITEARELLRA